MLFDEPYVILSFDREDTFLEVHEADNNLEIIVHPMIELAKKRVRLTHGASAQQGLSVLWVTVLTLSKGAVIGCNAQQAYGCAADHATSLIRA
jgi:hypothetical protein